MIEICVMIILSQTAKQNIKLQLNQAYGEIIINTST